MSVKHGLLALLCEGPRYGYELKAGFEARTGEAWPLNVGQVYTTLARLERDGQVERDSEDAEGHVHYRLTDAGRREVQAWWDAAVEREAPPRDELAIKLALALTVPGVDALGVLQRAAHRDRAGAAGPHPSAPRPAGRPHGRLACVLDALVFAAEAEVRWLDHCEARLPAPPARPLLERSPPMTPVLELRGASRTHGSGPTAVHALRGVDLVVQPGELVAVMGAVRLRQVDAAHPRRRPRRRDRRRGARRGRPAVGPRRRRARRAAPPLVGYVFQDLNLLPALTAGENVALPLELDGRARPRRPGARPARARRGRPRRRAPRASPTRCPAGSSSASRIARGARRRPPAGARRRAHRRARLASPARRCSRCCARGSTPAPPACSSPTRRGTPGGPTGWSSCATARSSTSTRAWRSSRVTAAAARSLPAGGGWARRAAGRAARLLRAKGRTALVALMVPLPVTAVVTLDTLLPGRPTSTRSRGCRATSARRRPASTRRRRRAADADLARLDCSGAASARPDPPSCARHSRQARGCWRCARGRSIRCAPPTDGRPGRPGGRRPSRPAAARAVPARCAGARRGPGEVARHPRAARAASGCTSGAVPCCRTTVTVGAPWSRAARPARPRRVRAAARRSVSTGTLARYYASGPPVTLGATCSR